MARIVVFAILGMARIVNVHHVDKDAFLRGNIESDPLEFDLVFERSPTYAELLEQVRIDMNWMDPRDVVELEGRHNVGFGMHVRWKTMRINSEQRWGAYKEVVSESLDKALEIFATKKVDESLHLDLIRQDAPLDATSPMNREETTEPPLTQQREVMQSLSPIANDQGEAFEEENDEHGVDRNEVELHDNTIGDLDVYNAQENMDPSIPYSRCYASDSDWEGPEDEVDEDGFTKEEAEVHKKVLGRDPRIPLFGDVSLAKEAKVDGGKGIVLGARATSYRDVLGKDRGISQGMRFDTLLVLQIWLKDFAVRHHRPYKVIHSDVKKRFTVKCEAGNCPWVVRARPLKGGPDWHITSCVTTHMCQGKKVDGKEKNSNRQLTSEFLAFKLSNQVASLPTMPIKHVIEIVEALYKIPIKYGKAWKTKQAAFRMLYGAWDESYNRIPRLLLAMADANPGMVHVVEPLGRETMVRDGRNVRYFGRAFWAFEQCVRAFEHCRMVISVDGTFLTGQYKGTILVAIANDANNRLVPLAFALVEAENNENWRWFFEILRTRVLPRDKEICVISDRHQGILNAVEIVIPGCAPLHHRWCMRHFCSNFYRACGNKDLTDDLQDCCQAYTDRRFTRLYLRLLHNSKLNDKGQNFLNNHIQKNHLWARAFDEGGRRYGQMTSNMAECFNKVLKGVRALPVTAIVQYTFIKMNEYFLKYSEKTASHISGENK